jgi:O-antigen/teichoic acid export membrane protein
VARFALIDGPRPIEALRVAKHAALESKSNSRVVAKRLRWMTALPNFVLYQSGTLCVVLTTLLVWPFLGRVLTQSQLGEVSLHLAIASIMAPALALGTHLYLANRFASERNLGKAAEARTAVSLTSTLYLVAILAVAGSFILAEIGVLLPVALSCASSSYLVTAGVTRGINRPVMFAVFALAVQVIGLFGLGFVTAATDDLRTGVLAYVLTIGVPVASQYLLLRRQLGPVEWSGVMRILRASASLVPHLVLAVALLTMMRVLVALQLGNQAAANYTFASLIIGGSITIGASLDAHWSVRAQAAPTIHELASKLSRNQSMTQLLLLVSSVGVVLFLFMGLHLWLPSGYDAEGVIIAVICALPAASLQALADGRAAVLMWMDRPGLVSASTALGTSVTIMLAYFLLPEFGWPVIGIVLTVGLSVRALATFWSARIVSPLSRVGSRNFVMLSIQVVSAVMLFAFV